MPHRFSRLQRAPDEIDGSAKYDPSRVDVYAAVRTFYALFGAPGSHGIFRFTTSSICSRGAGSTEVIAVRTLDVLSNGSSPGLGPSRGNTLISSKPVSLNYYHDYSMAFGRNPGKKKFEVSGPRRSSVYHDQLLQRAIAPRPPCPFAHFSLFMSHRPMVYDSAPRVRAEDSKKYYIYPVLS